jgi:hypothetical protein
VGDDEPSANPAVSHTWSRHFDLEVNRLERAVS